MAMGRSSCSTSRDGRCRRFRSRTTSRPSPIRRAARAGASTSASWRRPGSRRMPAPASRRSRAGAPSRRSPSRSSRDAAHADERRRRSISNDVSHRTRDWAPADDPFYVIDLTTGMPVPLDMGKGNFPLPLVDREQVLAERSAAERGPLLFETRRRGRGEPDGVSARARHRLRRRARSSEHADAEHAARSGRAASRTSSTWYERESDTLILRPVVPLEEKREYAVVLTDRLRGRDGSAGAIAVRVHPSSATAARRGARARDLSATRAKRELVRRRRRAPASITSRSCGRSRRSPSTTTCGSCATACTGAGRSRGSRPSIPPNARALHVRWAHARSGGRRLAGGDRRRTRVARRAKAPFIVRHRRCEGDDPRAVASARSASRARSCGSSKQSLDERRSLRHRRASIRPISSAIRSTRIPTAASS